MHLLAIVFIAIAVAVSFTKAAPSHQPDSSTSGFFSTIEKRNCYINGVNWADDIETANSVMQGLCMGVFSRTYIKGTISSSQWACRNISPPGGDHKKHMILYLDYIGSDESREIAYDECVSGFSKEINGCPRGGARSYWNWKYQ